MTDEEIEGTVIQGTRGPLRERADGTIAVTLIIQPQDKGKFYRLMPDIDTPVFIVRQNQESAKNELQRTIVKEGEKGEFGKFARELRLHIDWMGNPEIWVVVGSDTQYLDWCKDQPCANPACSFKPHWEMETWMQCDPAHVRRVANGSGTAVKPLYSAIPLCHLCHALQHQKGESAIVGKAGFDKLRITHVHRWVWERMRSIFNVESMSSVAPGAVLEWARENGLEKFLPRCYITDEL